MRDFQAEVLDNCCCKGKQQARIEFRALEKPLALCRVRVEGGHSPLRVQPSLKRRAALLIGILMRLQPLAFAEKFGMRPCMEGGTSRRIFFRRTPHPVIVGIIGI